MMPYHTESLQVENLAQVPRLGKHCYDNITAPQLLQVLMVASNDPAVHAEAVPLLVRLAVPVEPLDSVNSWHHMR
jgi:hypothetical protein